MEELPEDASARKEAIQRWADERWLKDQQPSGVQLRKHGQALARTSTWLVGATWRAAERALDRGLDTAGSLHEPEHVHPDRVHYVPTAWHVLPRALRRVGAGEDDTFVDFGCGKGRIVHQAARWPLRRVLGVEISPELAAAAQHGVQARRRQHRCRDVSIVVADAAGFTVPDDLTIGFFFDPFGGATLDAVLASIVASLDRRPRRIRLIYVRPRCGSVVLATGRFRLLGELRGGLKDVRLYRTAIFESC